MSKAAIYFEELLGAEKLATATADLYMEYASKLEDKIYNTIISYSGSQTSNIIDAVDSTHEAIKTINNYSQDFIDLCNKFIGLKQECEAEDDYVRQQISELSSTFCNTNGIKISEFEKNVTYHFVSGMNVNRCKII